MPIYEYRCADCGELTEAMQRVADPPLTECPKCGGALRKQISAPAFQFKGSGWYVTDYGRKGGCKEAGGADADGGAAKGDAAAGDKAAAGSGAGDKAAAGSGTEKKPAKAAGGAAD